jgi:hypothetical protein
MRSKTSAARASLRYHFVFREDPGKGFPPFRRACYRRLPLQSLHGALSALNQPMDTLESWPRREDDFKDLNIHGAATSSHVSAPSVNGSSSANRKNTVFGQIPGYTLMVAGQRSGKTSFLRLLLDTSNIAPTVSKEQLMSVARFIQGCSSHTSHIRHVSVDVILDSPEAGVPHPVTLTLIDTPSLDFGDGAASERGITDILRHVDSRFAESVEDASPLLS